MSQFPLPRMWTDLHPTFCFFDIWKHSLYILNYWEDLLIYVLKLLDKLLNNQYFKDIYLYVTVWYQQTDNVSIQQRWSNIFPFLVHYIVAAQCETHKTIYKRLENKKQKNIYVYFAQRCFVPRMKDYCRSHRLLIFLIFAFYLFGINHE